MDPVTMRVMFPPQLGLVGSKSWPTVVAASADGANASAAASAGVSSTARHRACELERAVIRLPPPCREDRTANRRPRVKCFRCARFACGAWVGWRAARFVLGGFGVGCLRVREGVNRPRSLWAGFTSYIDEIRPRSHLASVRLTNLSLSETFVSHAARESRASGSLPSMQLSARSTTQAPRRERHPPTQPRPKHAHALYRRPGLPKPRLSVRASAIARRQTAATAIQWPKR